VMLRAVTRGRVNPLVPLVAIVVGLVLASTGRPPIGFGVAIGGALAYFNGVVLSRRVDLAAVAGNAAGALAVMQVGLLVTMTIIGVVTVILVKVSLPLAVATAAGFGATQMVILATFYWTHARNQARTETQVT
jgi:hypothetical protein